MSIGGCKIQINDICCIDGTFGDCMTNLITVIQNASEGNVAGKALALKKEKEKKKIDVSLQKLENFLQKYESITSEERPGVDLMNFWKGEVQQALDSSPLDVENKKYINNQLVRLRL